MPLTLTSLTLELLASFYPEALRSCPTLLQLGKILHAIECAVFLLFFLQGVESFTNNE